jgi:hypothetical protein
MTQETQPQTISGVFAYAKIQEPAFKYQSTTEKEFSIDIIVDKATAKAFGKQFPKQKGKTVDNDDFEEIYKMPPPFPDQDEQFVLKLKRPAQYKDGKPLPESYWPKVMQKKGGKAVQIPREVLVGNGSTGKVSYDVNENDYGTFAKLKNILVEDLKEYKKSDGSGADDFGLELEEPTADEFGSADDGEGNEVKVPAKAAKTSSKPSKKISEPDEDTGSPF